MLLRSVLDFVKPRSRSAQRTRARRPSRYRLCLEPLEDRFLPAGYLQTNLASDIPGEALLHDPELIDAWGISINPNGTFWVSARATSVSTVYTGDVTQPDGSISPFVNTPLTVTIPGGAPTGQVFNGSNDFVVTSGAFSAPARFIFASETGHITGWNPAVPPPPPSRNAFIMASTPGAVYTGLAIGNNGEGNFLYAADFKGDKIDVFNRTYAPTTLDGNFKDPGIPDDYAPFNVWNIDGTLYVTYARPKVNGDGLLRGGRGFVSAFDTNGNFLRRVISQDHLLSPWGVAQAPADFGEFSGALLVANHQTGHINAFDVTSGAFLGRLRDETGDVIQIDGLYALHFGNGTVSGDRNALYFAAAPDGGAHGLFGSLRVAPATSLTQASGDSVTLTALAQLLSQDSSLGTAGFDQQWEFFLPAFRGLDVAVQRFIPTEPTAPVFALNYGSGSEALPALRGLQNAAARFIPGEPMRLSPIFFGLLGASIDDLLEDGTLT